MPRRRTARSAELKAKVALAAVQEQKTMQQIATLFGVHPTQVQLWKKQLVSGAASLFQTGEHARQDAVALAAREAELFEQIGRLKVELDWLKKKVAGGG